jgi:2,4-dienoyl-CoA reductase (NADPH2)
MVAYGQKLKGSVDYLHVVAGYGFINPLGNPGEFPIEEVKLFANSTRHLSGKAWARAAILNLLPDPIARPLFNIGWEPKEGISLEHARRFKREVGLPVITNRGYQALAGFERALTETGNESADDCDFVSIARALIANQDLLEQFRQGEPGPRNRCTHCNRCCARTATSPLGCYNVDRFRDRRDMVRQIFRLNSPDEGDDEPAGGPTAARAARN